MLRPRLETWKNKCMNCRITIKTLKNWEKLWHPFTLSMYMRLHHWMLSSLHSKKLIFLSLILWGVTITILKNNYKASSKKNLLTKQNMIKLWTAIGLKMMNWWAHKWNLRGRFSLKRRSSMSKNRESRSLKSKISGTTQDQSVRKVNLPKICLLQTKEVEEIQEARLKTLPSHHHFHLRISFHRPLS